MKLLSEESLLIAQNWTTVEDILQAVEMLRKDLGEFLKTLEPELLQKEWWHDGWVFNVKDEAQVYLTNKNWNTAVWIGIEKFGPGNLFGNDQPARLYVWVPPQHKLLGKIIEEENQRYDGQLLSDPDRKKPNYLIIQYIEHTLPDEFIQRGDEIRQSMIEFLERNALGLMKIRDKIEGYVGVNTSQ